MYTHNYVSNVCDVCGGSAMEIPLREERWRMVCLQRNVIMQKAATTIGRYITLFLTCVYLLLSHNIHLLQMLSDIQTAKVNEGTYKSASGLPHTDARVLAKDHVAETPKCRVCDKGY